MTEKKTFKNAMIQTEAVGDYHNMDHVWKITASAGHGNPYGTFSYEEWDMEVTFTKKEKPLSIGQVIEVYHLSEMPFQAVVLWYDDTWCLFQQSKYHNPEVCKRDKL